MKQSVRVEDGNIEIGTAGNNREELVCFKKETEGILSRLELHFMGEEGKGQEILRLLRELIKGFDLRIRESEDSSEFQKAR